MSYKKAPSNIGFTLVEVVIAISLLTIILGTAYSAITQIITTKRILDDKRELSTTAYAIIRRLTRELQLATANQRNAIVFPSGGNNNQNNSTNLFLLGEASGGDSTAHDSITFVALEGGQYLPDGGTHTGLVQISYRAVKDPEKKNDDNTFSLIREEIPYPFLPDSNDTKAYQDAKDRAFADHMVFPVTENLLSFSLRYFDAVEEKWLDEWGEQRRGTMPSTVYFSFQLKSSMGRVEEYSSGVPIGTGTSRVS